MKKLALYFNLTALIMLVLAVAATAQVWQEWMARYNGPNDRYDTPRKIATDSQGFIYVTGSSEAEGTRSDIVTIKYDSDGQQVWAQRYDGHHGGDHPCDMVVDAHGNVYVAGASSPFDYYSTYDWITLKYDADGNLLWMNTYNGPRGLMDMATGIAVDSAGFVYVAGFSNLTPYYFWANTTIIKYDCDGNTVWMQVYDANHSDDFAFDIELDHQGNVYVLDWSVINSDESALITLKYDSAGAMLWEAIHEGNIGSQDTYFLHLEVDDNRNVYVASTESFGGLPRMTDWLIIKYDSTGTQQWLNYYSSPGGSSMDVLLDLSLDNAGNLYATGSTCIEIDAMTTVKYNPAGELQWAATDSGGYSHDVVVDGQGSVYITGSSYWGMSTLKYDSLGQEIWRMDYLELGGNGECGYGIALGQGNNVYVTGAAEGISSHYDIVTFEYGQTPSSTLPQALSCPATFALNEAAPNPFNAETTISFYLPSHGAASLEIYDIAGKLVRSLANQWMAAGEHRVILDGGDLASGIYLCRLSAGMEMAARKIALLK